MRKSMLARLIAALLEMLTPDLINSAAKVRVGELDLYLTSLAIDVDDYVSVCQS